ncbi:disease resistance protein RPM1-like [Prunus avium]|uniref:Disease resistance protein RPM1-like n=1 Tax=Prunus avium TaxID=42229 RepID=A0A6P5TWB9_PRUAV|nr:disease resistance protein RPM1-like [Prunus avium]
MAEIAVQVALVVAEKAIIFLYYKLNHSSTVRYDVQKAKNCLERMRAYLRDYSASSSSSEDREGLEGLKNRVKQVQNIAYEIEDALDMFMLEVPHQFHSNAFSEKIHGLVHYPAVRKASHEFSSKIEDIMEKKLRFLLDLDSIHQVPGRDQEGRPSSSTTRREDSHSTHRRLEEEEIVGFEKPKQELIKQLVEGDNSRPFTIISLVGPGGSGKTTLLKNVFENKMVQGFFNCHAWIDVPRDLCDRKLRELLLNMLRKFDPKGKREGPDHHEDPEVQLRQLLEQKRFVLVLDNVWCKKDLERIVNYIPNGLPGSKVITTSRISDVASGRAKSPAHIHDLSNLLSKEDARSLFYKRAFPNDREGKCPPELKEWADKILKRCEGLPFAISAVGTLLAKKRPTPLEWKKLHDNLEPNLPIISQILQPSYEDLPSHLKTCFLYFSMFPEDYSISRERLIRLWVTEGFVMQGKSEGFVVQGRKKKPIEEDAEGYLTELIGRNLVHASTMEVDGRVRSCRVLNLVLDFIISKVENVIVSFDENCSCSTPDEKIRRLSVHNVSMTKLSRNRDLSCIRTLLVCGQASSLSELLKTFRFLKVLDLQGVPLEDFPNYVVGLTLLRYLCLRETNVRTVPKSIKKLGFLETFDLKQTKVTNLPAEIYALHNLRHLLVYRYDVPNYVTFGAARGVEVSAGNIAALSSIQKLSLITVKNNRKIIRDLGELKGLRKLGLTDLERKDGRELCCSVQKMEDLSTLDVRSTSEEEFLDLDHEEFPHYLQRLYLKGRLERLPKWISQLHSVAKIGLKWSKLNANENPLEALQALPNLMELDLVRYYTGEKLEFKKDTFKELKILHIEEFDQLNTMVVQNGAMPKLKKLTMSRCQNLELLPLGIEGLRSLDELLLYDMNNLFIARLQKGSEDRQVVEHIRVIHSLYLGSNQRFTGFQNLS